MSIFNKKEITKEDFNKLNQLDRIEFRQKMYFLNKRREESDPQPVGFFYILLTICGFIFLCALGMYNINPSSFVTLMNIIPTIIYYGIVFFTILIIIRLYFYCRYKKEEQEIINEYFPMEFKKNGKKRN